MDGQSGISMNIYCNRFWCYRELTMKFSISRLLLPSKVVNVFTIALIISGLSSICLCWLASLKRLWSDCTV